MRDKHTRFWSVSIALFTQQIFVQIHLRAGNEMFIIPDFKVLIIVPFFADSFPLIIWLHSLHVPVIASLDHVIPSNIRVRSTIYIAGSQITDALITSPKIPRIPAFGLIFYGVHNRHNLIFCDCSILII